MSLIVDASTALKWVLNEDRSAEARALVGSTDLLAPDFLLVECANVLAMLVRRDLMSAPDAAAGLEAIRTTPVRLLPSGSLASGAHRLAVELGLTAYDCLYLQLALNETAAMVTADGRFCSAVEAHGVYAHAVRLL